MNGMKQNLPNREPDPQGGFDPIPPILAILLLAILLVGIVILKVS